VAVRSIVRSTLVLLSVFSVLLGVVYPALVTLIAQVVFPFQANGSMMQKDGRVLGSALIGQPFSRPGYFWGRPSATAPFPCNGGASGGSNLGPTNPALLDAVSARVAALRRADPGNAAPIPVDLVTASGSGLDPDISPAAAFFQAGRVARTRGLPEEEVRRLVERNVVGRSFGVLGEPRVNVLSLNLALDEWARRNAGL
jgi:K+-transporting ATPase ATPase C chain